MKIILKPTNVEADASTKQYLCGPCSHYGGCS